MSLDLTPPETEEGAARIIRRLQRRFIEFCALLTIYDEDSRAITYAPNAHQRRLVCELRDGRRKFMLHKSRQRGNTTGIAAYLFFCALFTPRFRVAVVAQTHPAVMGIAEIYKRFVRHMPKWLREFYGVETIDQEVRFKHGGYIRFYTAGTDSVRGQNYQALHLSEVAFWENPDRTFSAIMSAAASPNVLLFLESTANGQNHWYRAWRELPGFTRLFFTWVKDTGLDAPVAEREEYDALPTPKHVEDLREAHGLTAGQVRWAKMKYFVDAQGSIQVFRQEQPTTAEEAFILSGDRVFSLSYLDVVWQPGAIVFAPPEDFVSYVLGADPAGGSTSQSSDYSAIKVLDVRVPSAPREAFSYYGKLPTMEFARMIHLVSTRYRTVSVVERNSIGTPIIEEVDRLNKKSVYELYSQESRATKGKKVTERLGFWTGENSRQMLFAALVDFIDNRRLTIVDPRLKQEINTCVWKAGKQQADDGCHDDMLMATGLALMGIGQMDSSHKNKRVFAREPRALFEILAWEGQTGIKVRDNVEHFLPSEWDIAMGEEVDSENDRLLGL